VIDNPILNSPFSEPARHFRFDDDGITNEIADGRRRSTYFSPIPKPKTRASTSGSRTRSRARPPTTSPT
jgi:type III restriction enzyme